MIRFNKQYISRWDPIKSAYSDSKSYDEDVRPSIFLGDSERIFVHRSKKCLKDLFKSHHSKAKESYRYIKKLEINGFNTEKILNKTKDKLGILEKNTARITNKLNQLYTKKNEVHKLYSKYDETHYSYPNPRPVHALSIIVNIIGFFVIDLMIFNIFSEGNVFSNASEVLELISGELLVNLPPALTIFISCGLLGATYRYIRYPMGWLNSRSRVVTTLFLLIPAVLLSLCFALSYRLMAIDNYPNMNFQIYLSSIPSEYTHQLRNLLSIESLKSGLAIAIVSLTALFIGTNTLFGKVPGYNRYHTQIGAVSSKIKKLERKKENNYKEKTKLPQYVLEKEKKHTQSKIKRAEQLAAKPNQLKKDVNSLQKHISSSHKKYVSSFAKEKCISVVETTELRHYGSDAHTRINQVTTDFDEISESCGVLLQSIKLEANKHLDSLSQNLNISISRNTTN